MNGKLWKIQAFHGLGNFVLDIYIYIVDIYISRYIHNHNIYALRDMERGKKQRTNKW